MNCMDTNDQPCTQEDRDRIRTAALDHARRLKSTALSLDTMADKRHWTEPERVVLIVAAAQLRQLAES